MSHANKYANSSEPYLHRHLLNSGLNISTDKVDVVYKRIILENRFTTKPYDIKLIFPEQTSKSRGLSKIR